ncbi:nuclear transport factor 2 family protein [Mycolicibacterium sp. BiH015]|uniref:nuclear transport factor 2 family protein n=1 Tax=Mycolicibacterium sp. BiH015 TaxID=3018808 RepID=UPI0022E5EAA8|nr:nuclear transport factor 2 family protein [Mycolicibacterium sp. BiH015]MDA2892060.1 nuclear transport factor 2 family protein [Mycolicibacterium sp. BiH015]
MPDPIDTVMLANLLDVFNERDGAKRQAAIAATYAEDVTWTDAEGVVSGRDALEAKCVQLQANLGESQFVAAGPVHALPGFGYLAWSLVDPTSGSPVMTGFDVALVRDGLITDLWTVLIPPA